MNTGVSIEYAENEYGKVFHISEVKYRAGYRCIECKQALFPRLGDIRAHHFAHYPYLNPCILSNPESALHFNVKMLIYSMLKSAPTPLFKRMLFGRFTCEYCGKYRDEFVWKIAEGWTNVYYEYRVGGNQADVVLLDGDSCILAIEVCNTNPKKDKEINNYKSSGVPMLEVDANEILSVGWEYPQWIPVKLLVPPPFKDGRSFHRECHIKHRGLVTVEVVDLRDKLAVNRVVNRMFPNVI